jgi:hypothetical protein
MFLETQANGLAGQTALSLLPFREIWAVDFEFNFGGCTGNNPVPVCLASYAADEKSDCGVMSLATNRHTQQMRTY